MKRKKDNNIVNNNDCARLYALIETLTKTHYTPSFVKYNSKYPVLSVRLTKNLKNRLDIFRRAHGDISYAQAIRLLLTEKKDMLTEFITLQCPKCNEKIILNARSSSWYDIKTIFTRAFFSQYSHSCSRRR